MRLLLPSALVILTACSGAGPADGPVAPTEPVVQGDLLIRNATSSPVAYVAATEGVLALLALPPQLERAEYEKYLVRAGATVPVVEVVGGYVPGRGVDFHLYRVDQATGIAHRAGSFFVSTGELSRTGGVAVVTPGRL